MKKMIFSAAAFGLVAVSSVALAPTTAEAIPAFARQTGAACLSCHFQSFPTLNAFGRSFKMNSFTDVGDQALIEDDMLSIPASLNLTVVIRPQLAVTNNGTTKSTSLSAPADQVVLFGGRVGSNTGAFAELGGGTFANTQLLNSWDMGGFKVGANFFNSGFGEDFGLALMNVWGQHAGMLGGGSVTMGDAFGRAGTTAGLSAFIGNDMAVLSVGGIDPTANRGTTLSLVPTARLQSFFDVGGFELGLGGIIVSGTSGSTVKVDAKRYGIDAQLMGELADMQVMFAADYASAKTSTAAVANFYNASTVNNRNGWSIRTSVKPTHNIIALVGFGSEKVGTTKTTKEQIGAEYEVYQNFIIALTHNLQKVDTAGTVVKTNTTTLDIEALM